MKATKCPLCENTSLNALFKVKNYVFQKTNATQYECIAISSLKNQELSHIQISHTLYHKYASSQNYYFTKEINEILAGQRTQSVIEFNDFTTYDEDDEFLKRLYDLQEYPAKYQVLAEFYKVGALFNNYQFHKDLPRWSVQKDILRILNYYYDRKRKIEYFKIQKIIEKENNVNPNQQPKGIVGDKPIESESTPQTPSSSSEEESKDQNVESILHELKAEQQPQMLTPIAKHASYIQFEDEEKRYSVLFGSPTSNTNTKQSIEIQQMISLLSIGEENKQNPKPENKAQRSKNQIEGRMYKKKEPEHQFQFCQMGDQGSLEVLKNEQPSQKIAGTGEANTYLFEQQSNIEHRKEVQSKQLPQGIPQSQQDKKGKMQKKTLKLDDFALSISARPPPQQFELKMPLSARYQPFSSKLMEQSKYFLKNSSSTQQYQTFQEQLQRKNLPEGEQRRQLLNVQNCSLQFPSKKLKLPIEISDNFFSNQVSHRSGIQEKTPRTLERFVHEQELAKKVEKTNKVVHFQQKELAQRDIQKLHNKKMFNQMLIPTEMKKLELKVLQGLQDLQKLKNTQTSQDHSQKMLSFDQKSLHQMLSKFKQKKKKGSLSQRLCESISQFESQNFSRGVSITPRGQQQNQKGVKSKNFNLLQPHKSSENLINAGKQNQSSTKSGRKSNNFSSKQQSRSPQMNQFNVLTSPFQPRLNCKKVDRLDLQKLMGLNKVDRQPMIQSARCGKRSIINEDSSMMKKIDSGIKTDRAPSSSNERIKKVHKAMVPGLNLNLVASRTNNNTVCPQYMTPKGSNTSRNLQNLMQWQIKAIQAAQREYNLIQIPKAK